MSCPLPETFSYQIATQEIDALGCALQLEAMDATLLKTVDSSLKSYYDEHVDDCRSISNGVSRDTGCTVLKLPCSRQFSGNMGPFQSFRTLCVMSSTLFRSFSSLGHSTGPDHDSVRGNEMVLSSKLGPTKRQMEALRYRVFALSPGTISLWLTVGRRTLIALVYDLWEHRRLVRHCGIYSLRPEG